MRRTHASLVGPTKGLLGRSGADCTAARADTPGSARSDEVDRDSGHHSALATRPAAENDEWATGVSPGTGRPRHQGRALDRAGDPEEGRARTRTTTNRPSMGEFPTLSGPGDPRHRPLHHRPTRRHHRLCPDDDRTRHPPHPHPRRHRAPHRRVDHSDGPQYADGPRPPAPSPGRVRDALQRAPTTPGSWPGRTATSSAGQCHRPRPFPCDSTRPNRRHPHWQSTTKGTTKSTTKSTTRRHK